MGKNKPEEVTQPPFVIHVTSFGVIGECGYCPAWFIEKPLDPMGLTFLRVHQANEHHLLYSMEEEPLSYRKVRIGKQWTSQPKKPRMPVTIR